MMPPSDLKPSSTGSDILQAVTQLQPKDTKLSVFGNQYAVDLKLNPWLRIASGIKAIKEHIKAVKDFRDSV